MKMKKLATILSVCAMVAMLFSFALTGSAADIQYYTIDNTCLPSGNAALDVDWATGGGLTLSSSNGTAIPSGTNIHLILGADIVSEYPYLAYVANAASTAKTTIYVWDNEAATGTYIDTSVAMQDASGLGFKVVDLSGRTSETATVYVDIYLVDDTGNKNIVFDDLYLASEKPTAARDKNAGSGDGDGEGDGQPGKAPAIAIDPSKGMVDPGDPDGLVMTPGENGGFTLKYTSRPDRGDNPAASNFGCFYLPTFTKADVEKNRYLVLELDETSTSENIHVWGAKNGAPDPQNLGFLTSANKETYAGKLVIDLQKWELGDTDVGSVFIYLCFGPGGVATEEGETELKVTAAYYINDAEKAPDFVATGYAPAAGIAAVAVLSTAALVVLGKKKKA